MFLLEQSTNRGDLLSLFQRVRQGVINGEREASCVHRELQKSYELLCIETLPLFERHGFNIGEFFVDFTLHLPGGYERKYFYDDEKIGNTTWEGLSFMKESDDGEFHTDIYKGMSRRDFYASIDETISRLNLITVFQRQEPDKVRNVLYCHFDQNIRRNEGLGNIANEEERDLMSAILKTYQDLRRKGFNHYDLTA